MHPDYPIPTWRPEDEFWWLRDPSEAGQLYCLLAHEDRPPDEESRGHLVYAPSAAGATESSRPMRAQFINEWWSRFAGINIFISRNLWHDANMTSAIPAPYLIDIDAEMCLGYVDRCRESLRVVRRVADELVGCWRIHEGALRVFFSGCKGFHLLIRRDAVHVSDLPKVQSPWTDAPDERLRFAVITAVRDEDASPGIRNAVTSAGTVIDKTPQHVRLAGSLNVSKCMR